MFKGESSNFAFEINKDDGQNYFDPFTRNQYFHWWVGKIVDRVIVPLDSHG